MSTFTTRTGQVTLSAPFSSIYHEQKQVEVKYTHNNLGGWGISRCYDANKVANFTQKDAELFAVNAESKLIFNGEAA
jgi:hypothetical protein